MFLRLKRWLKLDPDQPDALRLGFAAAYIILIGTLSTYANLNKTCHAGAAVWWRGLLVLILLALLFIERFDAMRGRAAHPSRLTVGLLALRFLLIRAFVALDCTGVAIFLYPAFTFAAYFDLPAGLSWLAGFILWLPVAAAVLRGASAFDTGLNLNSINQLIIFSLLLFFVQIIASHIDRDQKSRQRMRQLLVELEQSHRQLRDYAERVAELAAAAERNRLARDIHDGLGHYLAAISIQLEKAQAYRSRNPDAADQAVQDAKQSARAALEDVRQSVSTLRDADDRFSLRQALQGLARRMEGGPLEIDCQITGEEADYPSLTLMTLYRASQEGLTNVQKHAQAQHAWLRIELGAHEARLTLADDGIGLHGRADGAVSRPDEAATARGYGLVGLRERLELVSGQMTLADSDGSGGAMLTLRVPRSFIPAAL